LLALRCRHLEHDAGPRRGDAPHATRRCTRSLADLREAEAEIERIRASSRRKWIAERDPGALYEAGAEVTRIEQSIQYTRELRQRQRADLDQSEGQVQELRS
jgi:chromosome segregation protein